MIGDVARRDHSEDTPLVGVFGGSFNPPHCAHVLAVTYARLVASLDRVLVVPVFRHPFAKELVEFEVRKKMCELAFDGLPWVEISAVERDLGGESLTLRTLERLVETHPTWRFRLIVGSDVLRDLPKWHRWDRICELAPPLVLPRKGHTTSGDTALLPELSSSLVRSMFAAGQLDDLGLLVPRRVLDLAGELGLYMPSSGLR